MFIGFPSFFLSPFIVREPRHTRIVSKMSIFTSHFRPQTINCFRSSDTFRCILASLQDSSRVIYKEEHNYTLWFHLQFSLALKYHIGQLAGRSSSLLLFTPCNSVFSFVLVFDFSFFFFSIPFPNSPP